MGYKASFVVSPVLSLADKIKPFTIVDLTADYGLMKNFNIFGRIENLFNKHYQELRGYGEPGIGAYGGVKAKF